jgi:cytochrome b561
VIKNTPTTYGLFSRALHWLIAGAMLFLIGLGWYMTELSYYDPFYHKATNLHKSIGIIVFILLAIKVVWLFISPMPVIGKGELKKWEFILAKVIHKLLWLLIILMPITGYIVSTSAGSGIDMFGLFEIPAITKIPKNIKDFADSAHYYMAYTGVAIIALHVVGAAKYYFQK